MTVGKCTNTNCNKEIEVGDIIHIEHYFSNRFCSMNCLLQWSSYEYGWHTAEVNSIGSLGFVSTNQNTVKYVNEELEEETKI